MYDKNDIHRRQDNTNIFVHNGKTITLHPMKPELPKRGSCASVRKELLQVCHVYRGNANRTRVHDQKQSQWANATRPVAQMWGPKKSTVLFLILFL